MSREFRIIAVVYDRNMDEKTADSIGISLSDTGYDVKLYPLDENVGIEDAYRTWGSIHLVITVNLAGFAYRSSGNNSVYATLDYNSIHYIGRDVDNEADLLTGLVTITMMFLTDSKQRSDRLIMDYRRIHEVSVVSDIGKDIVPIVDNLDWRKEI